MRHFRFAAVLAAVLTVAACTGGSPSPTTAPTTSAPGSPTPAAPTYKASSLDLCNNTDLAPLADLSLKVEGTDNSPPTGGEGSACLFKMKTADGFLAGVRVEAMVVGSADEAQRAFQAQQNVSVMQTDGPISGLGDEAEGRTLDSEPGFKQSEYMVHMRAGNMTVKAWISVGGKEFTPKQTLAAKMDTMARAAFATTSAAWKQ